MRVNSPRLTEGVWETVGLLAVVCFQLTKVGLLWLDSILMGGRGYEIKDSGPMTWPMMIGLVMIVNLIFAGLVRTGTAAVSSWKIA